MHNKQDVNGQLARMRSLMKFGINEGKNVAYTGVEYEKVGADGKLYGIVREGAKYYIKTSPSKKGKLAENYDYIGGFRNRKNNEYSSFAEAQKQFDLKMMSVNEANAPEKKINVESWNPDKQEELTVESTDKMKKEISRERQIMMNVSRINEKKEQSLQVIGRKKPYACKGAEGCEVNDDKSENLDDAKDPKASFRIEKHKEGNAKNANRGYKNAKVKLGESSSPIACKSTENDGDYVDDAKDTEIGSSAPFTDKVIRDTDGKKKNVIHSEKEKDEVVEGEDKDTLIDTEDDADDNFNDENGDGLTEDIDTIDGDADVEDDASLDDDAVDDGADLSDVDDEDGEDDDDLSDGLDDEDDADDEDFDEDGDDEDAAADPEIVDIQNQISALNDKLDAILDAVGGEEPTVDAKKYEDDDLYGDEDDEDEHESIKTEARLRRNRPQIYESRAFKKMMKEEARKLRINRLLGEEASDEFDAEDIEKASRSTDNVPNDFGKHPSYQKTIMSLPKKDMKEYPGYYDMNDGVSEDDSPYGEKIGNGAPFQVFPEEVKEAVERSVRKFLGKRKR